MSAYTAALAAPAARFGDTVTDYLSGKSWTHERRDAAWYTCPACGGGVQVWAGGTASAHAVSEAHLLVSGLLSQACPARTAAGTTQ